MDARAATALILAALSVSLVFAAGRMSAWIIPVAGTVAGDRQETQKPVKGSDAAATKTAPAVTPGAAPSSRGMIEAAIGGAKTGTDPTKPSLPSLGETRGAMALLVAERALRGMEVAARQAPSVPDQSVTSIERPGPKAPVLLNAAPTADRLRAADNGRPAAASGPEPDKTADGAVGQCERRYSSFRRTDGTYQPLDGGPRRRCPLLR